ncbi:MAG TPA: LamG-like jellyroll fold domain-containing protein [Candidatus Baltobacteraceae bacterium]|nr:LamG-like jellyroll fold domain-containing protein [Candidatus Baltobacteraceae bacterium]
MSKFTLGRGNTGVSLPKPNLSSTSSYTIATWVYPVWPSSATAATQYMTIWGYNAKHRLRVSNSGVLLSQLGGNFFSAGKLTSGAWHQVLFVYDASKATESYYIDGKFDKSASLSNAAAAFTSAYYLDNTDGARASTR